jgi:hypothetical protein
VLEVGLGFGLSDPVSRFHLGSIWVGHCSVTNRPDSTYIPRFGTKGQVLHCNLPDVSVCIWFVPSLP